MNKNGVLNDVTCPSVTLVAIMDVNKVEVEVKDAVVHGNMCFAELS
jgi:hypothetical protein